VAFNITQVLWRASIDQAQDLTDIYMSTTGIIFLGTPHRGSDWSQTGKTLERIVAAVCFDTNSHNLKAVSPDSFELSLCQENFLRLYNRSSRHFEVRTFQEARGMTGVGYMGLSDKVCKSYSRVYKTASILTYPKIVDDNSSSLLGSSEERSQQIEDNHMNMCRFPSRDNDGYRKVVGELKKLLSANAKSLSSRSLQSTESVSIESSSAGASRDIQLSEVKYHSPRVEENAVTTPLEVRG
jgi:ankyrin repeat domain-containing protein 50